MASSNTSDISEAVGTGAFQGVLEGFTPSAPPMTRPPPMSSRHAKTAGGIDCTADEVTNDKLCIVSVADDATDVVAGGAGDTVEAARQDAIAQAAANGTPLHRLPALSSRPAPDPRQPNSSDLERKTK